MTTDWKRTRPAATAVAAEAVRLWQECPFTPPLTCSMDPDHPLMEWHNDGYLQCPEEKCGFIRYDINPAILVMEHKPKHRGCVYGITDRV